MRTNDLICLCQFDEGRGASVNPDVLGAGLERWSFAGVAVSCRLLGAPALDLSEASSCTKDAQSASFNRTSTENLMWKHVSNARQTKIQGGEVLTSGLEQWEIRTEFYRFWSQESSH